MPDRDPLYTPSQLAGLWNCSRAHIYNLMKSGRLASITVGRARRIRASDAEAFLAAHTLYVSKAEAEADREISDAARQLITRTRAAQGLPPTVTDVAVLDRLAALVDQVAS